MKVRLVTTKLNRIVSLEPSATATLVSLGQGQRLVAVSRYCGQLADVSGLPQLGTTWSVDADEVAALAPDLVLAGIPFRAGVIDSLLQKKLSVLCLYPQTLSDVYAHILWIGGLCDAVHEAERLVDSVKSGLNVLTAAVQHRVRQRVYVETWPDPIINAAPWVAEIVDTLGGEFVPRPPGRRVDPAEVFAADPQVILLAWAGVDAVGVHEIEKRPGWAQLSAVRVGRVVVLDEILVNAPGPNLAQGAQMIWRALYPGEPVPIAG